MATARTGLLGDARWERWAAYGGIAFVVLTVLWAVLVSGAPDVGSSNKAIRDFYNDEGDRRLLWLGSLALAFAGLAFLWFLGSLRTYLRRAEGEPGRLSAVAFGGGLVMVGLLFVKNAVNASIAATIAFGERFDADPNLVKLLQGLFVLLLGHEGVAAAVLVGSASVVALRTAILPRWFGWLGLAIAVLNVFSLVLYGVPLILFLAWTLGVSLFMLGVTPMRRTAPET